MLNDDQTDMPTTFRFDDHEVRVLRDEQGETWFIAGDVAAVLGYRDANNMVRWLDDDESDTQIVSIRSENGVFQSREVTIISEFGLYHALLKSRRPEAKSFLRWVTHEVLPALNRTGTYSAQPGTPESADASESFEAEWIIEECGSVRSLPILGSTAIAQFSSLVGLFEGGYHMGTDEAVRAASRVWFRQTGMDLWPILQQAFTPLEKSSITNLLDVSMGCYPPPKRKQ